MIERYDLSAELCDVTTRELGCDWCRSSEVTRLESELQRQREAFDRELKAQERIANDWALECKQAQSANADLQKRLGEAIDIGDYELKMRGKERGYYDNMMKRFSEVEQRATRVEAWAKLWKHGMKRWFLSYPQSERLEREQRAHIEQLLQAAEARATRAERQVRVLTIANKILHSKALSWINFYREISEAAEARAERLERVKK
jgi:hypothetical protein